MDDLVKQFAEQRTLAQAYRTLERSHLKRARDLELVIQRTIKREPLTKRDRTRLVNLIETGEIEFILPDANDPTDEVPF